MLQIPLYIENKLKNARYEYDKEAKVWCAWVPKLPGTYAQADSVEKAREMLAEVVEDYIIISLQKRNPTLIRQLKQAYVCS